MLVKTPRERALASLLQKAAEWIDGCRQTDTFVCRCDICAEASDLRLQIYDMIGDDDDDAR